MNKSRTSTTKKSVKSKNVSKNSASSTGIKVKKVSKTIHSKPSNNKRVTNTRKNVNTLNKNSNIKDERNCIYRHICRFGNTTVDNIVFYVLAWRWK